MRELVVPSEPAADRTRLVGREADDGNVRTVVGGGRLHEATDTQFTLQPRLVEVGPRDIPPLEGGHHERFVADRDHRSDTVGRHQLAAPDRDP